MEYKNLIEKGEKLGEGCYQTVEEDDAKLSVGDMVVWSDPDAGRHGRECELIHSEEWTVEVTKLRRVWDNYNEEYRLQIGNNGVGWINWEDIAIPGGKGNWAMTATEAEYIVGQFEESEYDEYRVVTHHMGKSGVPDDLWDTYKDKPNLNTGPHCEHCMGDGVQIRGR
jgi:hypothetical protein